MRPIVYHNGGSFYMSNKNGRIYRSKYDFRILRLICDLHRDLKITYEELSEHFDVNIHTVKGVIHSNTLGQLVNKKGEKDNG